MPAAVSARCSGYEEDLTDDEARNSFGVTLMSVIAANVRIIGVFIFFLPMRFVF